MDHININVEFKVISQDILQRKFRYDMFYGPALKLAKLQSTTFTKTVYCLFLKKKQCNWSILYTS